METSIAVFRGKEIRKTIHNDEWWFVVEDVVLPLIDSKDPKQYIQRMKQRDSELPKGWGQIATPLSVLWIFLVIWRFQMLRSLQRLCPRGLGEPKPLA